MEGQKQELTNPILLQKICFDSRKEFPIRGIFRHDITKKHQMKLCAEMDLNTDFESIQLILEEVNIRRTTFN